MSYWHCKFEEEAEDTLGIHFQTFNALLSLSYVLFHHKLSINLTATRGQEELDFWHYKLISCSLFDFYFCLFVQAQDSLVPPALNTVLEDMKPRIKELCQLTLQCSGVLLPSSGQNTQNEICNADIFTRISFILNVSILNTSTDLWWVALVLCQAEST